MKLTSFPSFFFFDPIFFHSILLVQPTRTKQSQNVRVVFPVLPHITPRKQLQRIFCPIEPGFPLSPPPPPPRKKKENFFVPSKKQLSLATNLRHVIKVGRTRGRIKNNSPGFIHGPAIKKQNKGTLYTAPGRTS